MAADFTAWDRTTLEQFAREATAKLIENREAIEELVGALESVTKLAQRNICSHDETHRGGAIWEICNICGTKWADDEGGKPDYVEPIELESAYAAITKHKSTTKEQ